MMQALNTYNLVASPLHRFTASPLHRFTASPLHRFTASPLHRFTASPLHRSHSCASELSRLARLRLGLLKPLLNLKPLGLAVALAAAFLGCAAGTRPASAVQERGDSTLAPHSSRVSGTVFRDALKDGGQGPQMVVLPTGRFRMGSPSSETGRHSDEGPVRTVTISRRIAMVSVMR